ncbi:SDR family oxidoreductase [Actibacterium sp. MT2.3-13A]|uniref:SDR family oxidoreductase n=1 Tax=Actibacterium sp. MT2.3-13A TaxID=2828332 RepID=UPI001BAA972D|nr:SDR family oxidoreductase [Actibacterium sp. MT2.3-13A]
MTILITGATRGIGLQLAQNYATAGQKVIGTARGAAPDLAGVDWHRLDVTDPASHAALAAALDGCPVDLLVCNAGIYRDKHQSLADGFPAAMWAETFATNVTGVFLTVQALLPNLQAAQAPKVAIISSRMGSDALAPGGSYIYRASKAAALNLGRNLAADLEGLGIAVGIYHPGWVRTDMGGPQGEIDAPQAAAGLSARFAALSLARTGCFETWDGQELPY